MVDDEIEVGVAQRGLLDVLGVGQMAERSRLVGIAFVYADQLEAALARLLDEPLRVVFIALEPVAGVAGISMAIPFPRVDAVDLKLALHLFQAGRLVNLVLGLVPVVVGREVALIQGALRAGHLIDLLAGLSHDPARQYLAGHARRARRAFENLAVRAAQLLFAWHA